MRLEGKGRSGNRIAKGRERTLHSFSTSSFEVRYVSSSQVSVTSVSRNGSI